MHSDNIKNIFSSNFTKDAFLDLNNEDDLKLLQYRGSFKNNLEKLYSEINLFIFSGEYIETKEIQDLINFLDSECNKLINSLEDILFDSFFAPLRQTTKILEYLKSTVTRKLSRNNNLVLIEGRKRVQINSSEDWMGFSEHLAFLEINCEIAALDHNLSVKVKQLESLIISLLNIQENIPQTYFGREILVEKCKLLISKISNRFEEDDKSYLYSFEFNDNEIRKFRSDISIFKKFIEQFESHYLDANKKDRIDEINKIYDSFSNEGYDLKKFHSLIKNYKDDNKSLIQIENLLSLFKEQYDIATSSTTICPYDKKAWDVCYNYLVNNKLSALIHNKEASLFEIEQYLQQIQAVQHQTFVRNYFPYLQFLKRVCQDVKNELEQTNPDFKKIFQFLDFYNKYIKDLYQSFEWCQDNNFQAYVLNKDLCLVDYNSNGTPLRLFIASSFILPINYRKVNIEIEDLKRSIEEFKTHVPLFKRILEEEKQILLIRNDIEKRDRNQIEILGIFAAVVLFAAGGISIFKETPSLDQSAKYSLIFSYSLSLFVLLIWLITRDYSHFKPSRIHYFFACLYAIATLLIFAISFNWWPTNLF